jgi:hypothetical protein
MKENSMRMTTQRNRELDATVARLNNLADQLEKVIKVRKHLIEAAGGSITKDAETGELRVTSSRKCRAA